MDPDMNGYPKRHAYTSNKDSVKCVMFYHPQQSTLVTSYPTSASPHLKYIDAICDRSHDQAFCLQTLTTNPPTAAPID
ncbi:hypothetical protein YC2023_095920 [Brassica napus]